MADSTLTFGPKEAQWLYSRDTKTYDLSRSTLKESTGKKFTMDTTEGPAKAITIDPGLSALVIIDMQNFFLSPKCRDHPLGLKAVQPTIDAIKKARETGIKVSCPPYTVLPLHHEPYHSHNST